MAANLPQKPERRRSASAPPPPAPDSALSPELAAALAAAEQKPLDEGAWEALETLAADLQQPEHVAALYLRMIKGAGADAADQLGQRAVRFHEEWFGDDQEAFIALLKLLLSLDASLEWAFERLTLLLSMQQRWNDLLSFYDETLATLRDGPRRRKILQEAAGVAKDFLGEMDRAIGYTTELFRAKPADPHVASALERLLERERRFEDLAEVWRTRLEFVSGAELHELRGRLARLALDELKDPQAALAHANALLKDRGDDSVACQVLESILALPSAAGEVRKQALELLRAQHERQGRKDRIVELLQTAHEFASDDEKAGLLREAALRLQAQGDTPAAMDKLVELLSLTPNDAEIRTRLRHLAELSGAHDQYVNGLSTAAAATRNGQLRSALLIEAGRVEEDVLHEPAAAISFFERAADDSDADDARKLTALRRLSSLLDRDEHNAKRLSVLERLAQLTAERAEKRTVLGQAGRLAGQTGEIDRAVGAWQLRLEIDEADREALDALVELLSEAGRSRQLVEILRKRVEVSRRDFQRRSDLARIAQIQANELGDLPSAIETWLELQQRFGEDGESISALRELLGREQRFTELAALLSRTGERDRVRLTDLFCRLGDVHRERLQNPVDAARAYRYAIEIDPAHPGARAGLQSLLGNDDCRESALAALVHSYNVTDETQPLVALTDLRLQAAPDDLSRARVLIEVAERVEKTAQDHQAALDWLCRALVLSPENARLEADVLRLAPLTDGWQKVVGALRDAIVRLPNGADRVVQLRLTEAQLLERHLGLPAEALQAYEEAGRLAPDLSNAKLGRVRVATALGRWDLAAKAMLSAPVSSEVVTGQLLPLYEQAASAAADASTWTAAAQALAQELGQRKGIPRTLCRDIECTIASWHEKHRGGAGEEDAEAALLRALKYDRDHAPTLRQLAGLQRKRPGRPLFDTLAKLATLDRSDLDLSLEALTLAETVLSERQLALKTGFAALEHASHMVRAELEATGRTAPAAAVETALAAVVRLMVASGVRADAARAVSALLDATALPLPEGSVRALRRQAARLALDTLSDRARARDIYRVIVEDEPADRAAIAVLAGLYEEADLLSEALGLRRRELSLDMQTEERLSLRLEMARIAGLVEERSNRVSTLLANLDESPGHAATVDELSRILRASGRDADLCDILSGQARSLEKDNAPEAAGKLWAQVARLAESALGDKNRALTAYERVANLTPDDETFAALARLCLERGEPLAAASWLEQRLQGTTGDDRVPVALEMGRAYLAGGQRHRAIGCLERTLAEKPDAHELRALLIATYREGENWDALAHALSDGCLAQGVDADTIAAYAREAAAIYQEHLGKPDQAVPVLQKAVELLPSDRWLRTSLAQGLRVAGQLQEARSLLEVLLEEMGRRRSKERAAIHHQLALVARAEGDLATAMDNLDQAAAIDMSSMEVLIDLGETAEQAKELPRAERAYRALLVLARRGDLEQVPLSPGEILLRLQTIAKTRGEGEAAVECFESASAAAMQNAIEARRMQRALLARGEAEVALELIDKRRTAASGAAAEGLVLCERAELLDEIGRRDDALQAVATAIEKAPDLAAAHTLARRISGALGEPRRYLDIVVGALEQMRRRDDGARVCDLLLRAGEVAENDLGDHKQAASFYARAEQTSARTLDVFCAIARISAVLDDQAEETRALKQLARMAEEAESPDEQAEVLFRTADLQLRRASSRIAGLETLAAALEKKADFARALATVRAAEVPEDELPRVMSLYERVARSSGDDRMLLDYLERRAASREATQEEVSEAVELALALGESARIETLLERAVELAEARGAMREAAWALIDLAQRRRTAGDLDGAFRWLEQASQASESPRIPVLLRELAREATAKPGGAELAARAFESLRRRNPSERELWQPLLELYVALGAEDKLRTLVNETVEKLVDRHDRTAVRLLWARFLLDRPEGQDEAASILRDILLEEPGHREALARLADLHDGRGEVGETVALLSEALREAESRADGAWHGETVRRLGEVLKKADPDQAKDVYRQALSSQLADPELRRDLQRSLFELLGDGELDEKADLAEKMLADESGAAAARHALELADLRRELGDEEAEMRALLIGRQHAPESTVLFDRLSSYLEEREQWQQWAQLMDEEAARLVGSDEDAARTLLREAAQTRRDKLGDTAGAIAMLRKAATLGPVDLGQIRDLCEALGEANDRAGAIEVAGDALGRTDLADADRLALLLIRSDLHLAADDAWQGVSDLESALALDAEVAGDRLTDALYAAAQQSARKDDLAGQRKAVMRLAELYSQRGDSDRAQKILFDWADDHPEDKAALRALRERFEAAGRWEDAARVCDRLVEAEENEAKIEAALGLAHAYEQLGRPTDATPTLEALLVRFPGQPALVNVLSGLYVAAGDTRRVAELKIQQADLMQDEDERFAALTDGADMLLQNGEPQAAIEAINRAFALRPDDRMVQRLLADALLANGQFDQAANVLDQLIGDGRGIDGGELAALYHRLSRAAGGMGNHEEQLGALKKAIEADRKNGVVAAELADLAEAMGDDDNALKALRSITLHCPDGPMPKATAFYRQARIAFKNGDRQRALIFAKRALQEDAELPEAKELLEQLR